MQQAQRMHRIVIISVASLVVQEFYTLSHKEQDFWKNIIDLKLCFDFL
jgi:hypothetical protein